MNDEQQIDLPISTEGSPLDGTAKLFPNDQKTPWEFDTAAQAKLIAQRLQSSHRAPHAFVYCLPLSLLSGVCSEIGVSRFDNQALQDERDLAAQTKLHGQVGYWGIWPIVSDLLETGPPPQEPDDFNPADFGMTKHQLRDAFAAANSRLKSVFNARSGYAGWLTLNRRFVEEHDALLQQYRDQIVVDGFPVAIDSTDLAAPRQYRRAFPLQQSDRPDNMSAFILEADSWLRDYQRFCERWRLSHLAGPYLPEPLMPQIPLGVGPAAGTQVFVIPDIYPIGGRGFIGDNAEKKILQRGRGWS